MIRLTSASVLAISYFLEKGFSIEPLITNYSSEKCIHERISHAFTHDDRAPDEMLHSNESCISVLLQFYCHYWDKVHWPFIPPNTEQNTEQALQIKFKDK